MASPAAVVSMSSASKATAASFRKLMSQPQALNKTLAGLRVRAASDYVHNWVPVPGVATAKKSATATTSSSSQATAAPSILNAAGERTRMRWQQSKVSARVLADIRKKVARLERAGIALATHPETGAPIPAAQILNLPAPKPLSTKTVRMGKPDKGRKHDRTAPERKAKIAKAISEMPKTIETWKKAKAAEKTKTKNIDWIIFITMSFSSLLSDHEQKAFTAFLGQLAQEERYKVHNSSGLNGDPGLSHHQHQLPHQPQLHAPQRQPQPQLPLSPTSINGDFIRSITDPSTVQSQQQQDWLQQITSNPILAPGGIIDPHAMSQAFLQNPDLMAQASAISQAMVLAQQQQMQLQMQQQQNAQQEQAMMHASGLHHDSRLPYESQSPQRAYQTNSPPGQYSPDQQQYYALASNDPSVQQPHRTLTKRKSQSNLHSGEMDGHDQSPPPLPMNGNMHHSYSSSPSGYYEAGYLASPDNDDGFGPSAKKVAGRKGSNESHRSSRDGSNVRRKASGSPQYDTNNRRQDYSGDNRDDSEEVSFPGPTQEHRNGLINGSSGQVNEGEYLSSRHRQHSSSESQASRTRSPTSNNPGQSKPKKAPHELLTDAEKKANHIASEQKRRQNIRIGFDSLVEIVPTLSECHRSEALILQKSVDYIHRLLSQKQELKSRVRDLQANLGEPTEDADSIVV
ncbi:hypothetical protein BGZ79_001469 [Entomortierella chlamydospora]|nr:hypothetical protein BGZ79_001469 [Entomortierella chlamydospora]